MLGTILCLDILHTVDEWNSNDDDSIGIIITNIQSYFYLTYCKKIYTYIYIIIIIIINNMYIYYNSYLRIKFFI